MAKLKSFNSISGMIRYALALDSYESICIYYDMSDRTYHIYETFIRPDLISVNMVLISNGSKVALLLELHKLVDKYCREMTAQAKTILHP